MKKKAMSLGETIQVLEIDPGSAVGEQPWAHHPKHATCKDWDGWSEEYEKLRRALGKDAG